MLFKDHYQKAPKKIQEVVDSFETAETLAQIAADHSVDDNKGTGNRDLGRLTGRVLVGMLHPKDFVPELVEKLDIPKEKAQEIAKEVNQKIFSQVKDLLIELHGLKKEEKIIHHTLNTPQKTSPPVKPSQNSEHGASPKRSLSSLGADTKDSSVVKPKNSPSLVVGQVPPAVPQAPKKEASPKAPNSSKPLKADDKQGSNVTKPTNPFEEKLRQTFTIPPKNHSVHSGHAPKNSLPLVSKQAPQDSIPKPPTSPSSPEDSGTVKKKEEIKNNPYLETIE